jgi:hypothetical protein
VKGLVFLLILLLTNAGLTTPAKVTFKKMWQIPAQTKFEKFTIGGLSGCAADKDKIYFVSDDRGNQGKPRILVLNFDLVKVELNVKDFKWLQVKETQKNKTLDLEGLALLPSGQWLISNEGDLNQKPRQPAELFFINSDGLRTQTISLPEKYFPNVSGKQTKGIQNNMGFEGLTYDPDQQLWAAFLEGPLVQDPTKLIMVEGSASNTAISQEWSYPLPQYMGEGIGAGMGVTDFVYLKNKELLLIERGVSLSLQGVKFDSQLCTAEKNYSNQSLKKDCFYDFSADKTLMSLIKENQNFEGICWLNDQKTLFLIVNDNNFSKTQNSLFLLYQID